MLFAGSTILSECKTIKFHLNDLVIILGYVETTP